MKTLLTNFSIVCGYLTLAFVTMDSLSPTPTFADDRPNIVIVMVDDMGWSDLGCFGGEVQTPNVDQLAKNGLRFNSFYNTGRCCPTRASLLTGLYPHQAGLGQMTFDRHLPGYRGQLTSNTVTIAEVLQQAGYRTAMVGKWHLSLTESLPNHMKHLNNQVLRKTFSDPNTYPVSRGFEEHYGIIWGVVNYYDPFSLVHNTTAIEQVPEDYYITDAFTDQAVDYIEKYSQGDEPFFLYLAHCAPHWPIQALPEDIKKYEKVYQAGWQAIREQRDARIKQQGLLPSDSTLSERIHPEKSWEENSDANWDAHAMACHAAMIDRVDQGMGKIIAKLKELDEFENTLILFLSDNGASREEPSVPGFDRTSETREGTKVTYYGKSKGNNKPKKILPGPETTYAGIGPDWANVANTPFRFFKATQFEGGIRTPLIAHWPKGIKGPNGINGAKGSQEKQNSITSQSGHVIDFMPTCVELAKTTYPKQFKDQTITPVAGKSLVPILQGKEREGHAAIYFEHFGAKAIRQGEWKLVAGKNQPWQLYQLSQDPTETKNLAEEHLNRVKEMSLLWETWAHQAKVFPNKVEKRK